LISAFSDDQMVSTNPAYHAYEAKLKQCSGLKCRSAFGPAYTSGRPFIVI